jgi:thioesterase domain-containing protein
MSTNNAKETLISYISEYIPALGSLGAEVIAASVEEVVLSAPLAKNHNDKGSAFAGSQYLLAIAASWSLAYLNARAEGVVQPDLIGAEGKIKYLKPARAEQIVARAKADPEQMQRFRHSISRNRTALLNQQAIIEDGGAASEFQVKFVLPKSAVNKS